MSNFMILINTPPYHEKPYFLDLRDPSECFPGPDHLFTVPVIERDFVFGRHWPRYSDLAEYCFSAVLASHTIHYLFKKIGAE